MDKSNQCTYCSENQFLIVERHFTGSRSIEELVKQYVSEQATKMNEFDGPDNVRCNCFHDRAVVTSAKEDGE